MKVGNTYQAKNHDYQYRIIAMENKRVCYIRVEELINPHTGNTVNILDTEHECWETDFKKKVIING